MGDSPKETVIIVHGTWAAPKAGKAQWYQPSALVESFVAKLNVALKERGSAARCWEHCADGDSFFHWSPGENSWIARTQAASALADYVNNLRKEGWSCHIIAHSHGGNVVIEALPQIIAASEPNGSLGKIVTLGTPFMNTLSPIRRRAERQENLLKKIGWGIIWFYAFCLSLAALGLVLSLLDDTQSFIFVALALVILALLVVLRRRRRISDVVHVEAVSGNSAQPQASLLAIGCPTDEAWQVLHHLPTIDNPLAVRYGLLFHLISSVKSQAFRLRQVARIRGARSFRDIGLVAKCVAAFLDFYVIAGIFALFFAVYRSSSGDIAHQHQFRLMAFVVSMSPVFGVILALVLRPFLGAAFYSAFWSPFRWCGQLLQSLASLGPALGTYLIRRWSWSVFLKVVMGLDNYDFDPPPITQCPGNLAEAFAKYENMPTRAEQRALEKRGAWIARHLGDVSQTFANLVVTASDLMSLLRMIEADQTLVHAAYYTDDDCIARIADWIAGEG
ncbi:lipase family protein [Bradyrhizobium diazoefficiens]